jgi:hypothetical protein
MKGVRPTAVAFFKSGVDIERRVELKAASV